MRTPLALACLLLLPVVALAAERTYKPKRVVDPFPAITKPPLLPAAKVKDQVNAAELVLGVVVGGEARAYPINMLTGPEREIINDRLGGRSIAATW